MLPSVSQGGATDNTEHSSHDDFCFTLPGPPPETNPDTIADQQRTPHAYPGTMVHSVSPLEASFSLANSIPTATAPVATPPMPQQMPPTATPVASNATVVTADAAQSISGISTSGVHDLSITLRGITSSSPELEKGAVEDPEATASTFRGDSGGPVATDETPVASSHASTTASQVSATKPIPRSPIPPLKLPLRMRMATQPSSSPQMHGMHASEEFHFSPPPAPRSPRQQENSQQLLLQRAASARLQQTTGATHHSQNEMLVMEDASTTCGIASVSGASGPLQQLRPASAPVRSGVGAHSSGVGACSSGVGAHSRGAGAHNSSPSEPARCSPSPSSPTVALITSSLSPQPHTRRRRAQETDDALYFAKSDLQAQAYVRHSGDTFDASAHASRLGSSLAQATTRMDGQENDIATTSRTRTYVVEDPPNSIHSHGTPNPGDGVECNNMSMVYERKMQAAGMASEAPSGTHGAAFVRRELLKRSEEQAQRETDALFEVCFCHIPLAVQLGNVNCCKIDLKHDRKHEYPGALGGV